MSNKPHVQQPMVFSEADLNQRKEVAKQRYLQGEYRSTTYSGGMFNFPATEVLSWQTPDQMIDAVIELALQGRKRFTDDPVTTAIGYYSVRFFKADNVIEQELQELYVKVEAEYLAEIEAFNTTQVELLAQQLYEAEQKKEQKKLEEKEAKAKAAALVEAQKYFQSLVNEESK
ncbi:hypothetical protein D9M70_311450 [compost metagenome]